MSDTQSSTLPPWITDGYDANTFYITSAAELKALADQVNAGDRRSGKTYKLVNDIDLSDYAPGTTLGGAYGWTPIGKYNDGPDADHGLSNDLLFAGVFDGQGHTVRNLTIHKQPTGTNASAEGRSQGLFGYVYGLGTSEDELAQVKNLIVENASIISYQIIGAVVAYYGENTKPLTNCAMVGGSVEGVSANGADSESIGGVAGTVQTSITNCYATGSVAGKKMVGGVVGSAVSVSNCYATGEVHGNYYGVDKDFSDCNVGGVAGSVGGINANGIPYGTISNCYATGSVICDSMFRDVGGIAGSVGRSITNCAALGRAVSGGTVEVFRVVGIVGESISGAYAWNSMRLNGSTVTDELQKGLTHENGADLTASDGKLYTATGTFGWDGFDATSATPVWELRNTEANKLPKLIGSADDPTLNLVQETTDGATYTITFDKQSGTGGTNNVTATLGEAMPAVTPPTRTGGYTFAGYFDAAAGGTKYYNADGSGARTWDKSTAGSLYAQWVSLSSSGGNASSAIVTLYNIPDSTIWLTGSGLSPSDLLITEQLFSGSTYNAMLRLANQEEVFKVYNIYLRSGVKSTGAAMYLHFDLANKYAGQAFTLVHQKADGTAEYFYATADANGDLAFGLLYELSPFMLVKGTLTPQVFVPDTTVTSVPKTGDNATPFGWALLIVAMLGACGMALRKKRV